MTLLSGDVWSTLKIVWTWASWQQNLRGVPIIRWKQINSWYQDTLEEISKNQKSFGSSPNISLPIHLSLITNSTSEKALANFLVVSRDSRTGFPADYDHPLLFQCTGKSPDAEVFFEPLDFLPLTVTIIIITLFKWYVSPSLRDVITNSPTLPFFLEHATFNCANTRPLWRPSSRDLGIFVQWSLGKNGLWAAKMVI